MNARARRSSPLAAAAAAVTVLAIGGCGGSGSQHTTRPRAAKASTGTSSTVSSAAPAGTSSTVSSAGTATVGAAGTDSAGADSGPAAKVTFAAPGGESQAQFVSAADSICRSFRARAHAIGAAATTFAAQETELRQLLTATEQSVKALTDLSPPPADAAGLRRFADMTVGAVLAFAHAQSRTSSTSEAVGSQVEARDLADSSRSAHDAAAAQVAARTLRLHVCGSSGSAWL